VIQSRQSKTTSHGVKDDTKFATHFPETLVYESIWDVKEIADYGVTFGTRRVWQASRVVSLALNVGIKREEDGRH
jgi:hypothetical protein